MGEVARTLRAMTCDERVNFVWEIISGAASERDGQARMDDDGAPPVGEVPPDAYRELVAETVRLSMRGLR